MNRKEKKLAKKEEKKQLKEEQKIKKEKEEKVDLHLFDEIAPIVDYKETKNMGYAILEDGSLMDFVLIKGKDLYSMSYEDLNYDNFLWSKLYKRTAEDLKILALNFPTDTSAQINYYIKKYEQQKNPILKSYIAEQIEILKYISENRTDREYILMFYAEDEAALNKKRREIISILSGASVPLFEFVSNEKKKRIFFKLQNKNTLILAKKDINNI